MSLQFILGSSGSGKSHILYQEILDKAEQNKSTNYFMIVPEQFTMQTQKELVSLSKNKGILNIDVLSFLRLSYRIFEEQGTEKRLILEDTGKNMVLRKVAEQKKEELVLFTNNIKKYGFISELKSILSELYQYSITKEQLKTAEEKSGQKQMLKGKIQDIRIIYEAFEEYLSEKYITAEEILELLAKKIKNSAIIQNSVICLDGFTGFTPSQNQLISELLKYAKKIIIAITVDVRSFRAKQAEYELFYLSHKTIEKLKLTAQEIQVKVENPVLIEDDIPIRFANSQALAFLEKELFRFRKKVFREHQDEITIHSLKNKESEVRFVVREIQRLVREEKYRYRDIAVITGDMEGYGRFIEMQFQDAGIPCFADYKRPILSNPLVEGIRSVLDIAIKDYSYETVFRYLRAGLSNLTAEEIDVLENYVIALGVRGKKQWTNDFTKVGRTKRKPDLEFINKIREKVMDEILETVEKLRKKGNTVLENTRALYDFLVRQEAEVKLREYEEMFEARKERLRSKEMKQIYPIIMELMDKMAELLGDEKVSLKEYEEILASGLSEVKVGLIPPGIDQIVAGDIERTRLTNIRALFFIGVNDGIVPKKGKEGGVLTDREKEFLHEMDVELSPTKKQAGFTEQFYLYLALTKPQEKLYLSYTCIGEDGKTMRPAHLIYSIRHLFSDIRIQEEVEIDTEKIFNWKDVIEYVRAGIKNYAKEEMDEVWKTLYSLLYEKKEGRKELLSMIDAAYYEYNEDNISKAAAHVLYGNELNNSVTRLEQYAACAFSHFLTYGLELKAREEFRIEVPDLGNLFHESLDLFSKKLEESCYNWHTVPEEEREKYVFEAVREAVEKFGSHILKSSRRLNYLINRIERITSRTVWALCEQIKKGEFEPECFEMKFSYLDGLDTVNVALESGEYMRLTGRIDRLDTCTDEESVYVKVVDYKSGKVTFDILSLFYGLQLQLIVYLNAAVEFVQKKNPVKEAVPAGVFYYHIDDPMVEGKKNWTAEEREESLLKELKMSGLVSSDITIAGKMDQTLLNEEGQGKAGARSAIIPMELNKDGVPGKRSNTADTKQFQRLGQFVKKKIAELGTEMVAGNINVNPYKLGDKTACDYCPYSGVCGFDTKLKGYRYRRLSEIDKEEIWKKIEEEQEDGRSEMDKGTTEGN